MSAVFWMKLQQFNVKSFLKRQRLFFRGAMIKKRNFNGKAYSFADLTGHGAFVFLAISYLETDITNLRLYAASGISLSILFQYYRAIPLWLPIKYVVVILCYFVIILRSLCFVTQVEFLLFGV